MPNNYSYLKDFYLSHASRLEEALENIAETDDIQRARMIASAALGRPAPDGKPPVSDWEDHYDLMRRFWSLMSTLARYVLVEVKQNSAGFDEWADNLPAESRELVNEFDGWFVAGVRRFKRSSRWLKGQTDWVAEWLAQGERLVPAFMDLLGEAGDDAGAVSALPAELPY